MMSFQKNDAKNLFKSQISLIYELVYRFQDTLEGGTVSSHFILKTTTFSIVPFVKCGLNFFS